MMSLGKRASAGKQISLASRRDSLAILSMGWAAEHNRQLTREMRLIRNRKSQQFTGNRCEKSSESRTKTASIASDKKSCFYIRECSQNRSNLSRLLCKGDQASECLKIAQTCISRNYFPEVTLSLIRKSRNNRIAQLSTRLSETFVSLYPKNNTH